MSPEPATIDFGTLRIGNAQPATGLVFRNTGTTTTGALSVRLTGSHAFDFMITNDACAGARLVPDQACTVIAVFAPHSSGAKSAALEVRDLYGTFSSAALAGTAEQVSLQFSRSAFVFGDLFVGGSEELVVSVTNAGDATSRPLGLALEECDGYYDEICTPASNYSLGATTCAGVALSPGANCTVAVVYNPQESGYHSGYLVVEENGVTVTMGLAGTSATTEFDVAPGSLTFPATQVGASSIVQVVTLTNSGPHPSEPVTLTVQVCSYYECGISPHFELGANSCAGAPLPADASCTIPVIFRPQTVGYHVAQLWITGADSPYGIDFASLAGQAVAGP
jgi:hypothetical protein